MSNEVKASRRKTILLMASMTPVVLLTSCLSPTLPLPPPSRPDVSPPDARGLSTINGRVPSKTTALVQNLASGKLVGQVTDDTGFYQLTIAAEVGDRLAVWYRDVYQDSGSIVVIVPSSDEGVGLGGAAGAGPD